MYTSNSVFLCEEGHGGWEREEREKVSGVGWLLCWFLEFYRLATSKVILGRILNCDSSLS